MSSAFSWSGKQGRGQVMMVMKEGDMITSLQLQVFIEHYHDGLGTLDAGDTQQ